MLNLNSLMVNTQDAKRLAEFYGKVFDKKPEMVDEAGGGTGWQVGACFFGVGQHSEVHGESKDPSRIMFNLETDDVQQEFARISKIDGAKVIKEPYSMADEGGGEEMKDFWIATFADPDGNYFQLMSPWKM
jgi:predicted enzyme related to lactoylglutathione lyase